MPKKQQTPVDAPSPPPAPGGPQRVRIHFTGPTLVRGCAGNPSQVDGEQVGQWVYFKGEQASAPRLRMHVASGGFFLEDLPEPTE